MQIKSTPGKSPWINGKCGRMTGLVKDKVRILRGEGKNDWKEVLLRLVYVKNCVHMKNEYSQQTSTGIKKSSYSECTQ